MNLNDSQNNAPWSIPQSQKFMVRDYVMQHYTPTDDNDLRCNYCSKTYKPHMDNLKRHLRNIHPKEAKNYIPSSATPCPKMSFDYSHKPKANNRHKNHVTMNRQSFLKSCIKFAVSGVTLTIFDHDSFRHLIAPACENFDDDVSTKGIQQTIKSGAAKIRDEICHRLKDRIISLKLDGISRYDQSIICVSAQYISGATIHSLTLGIITVRSCDTIENIKTRLLDLLDKYEIKGPNIYAILTDIGANYFRSKQRKYVGETDESLSDTEGTTSSFSEGDNFDPEKMVKQEEPENGCCSNNKNMNGTSSSSYYDDSLFAESVSDEEDAFYGSSMVISRDNSESADQNLLALLKGLGEIICGSSSGNITTHTRSVTHTIQLVVADIHEQNSQQLQTVRNFLKTLSSPKFKSALWEREAGKWPKLDVTTRWVSTYKMIETVYENSAYYKKMAEQNEELTMGEDTWSFLEQYTFSFEPLKHCALKLRNPNVTLSDYFLDITDCIITLTTHKTDLSESILKAFEKRKYDMFDNDALYAALYLDPRVIWTPLVTADQIKRGKDHLLKLSEHMETSDGNTTKSTHEELDTTRCSQLDIYIANLIKEQPSSLDLSHALDKFKIKTEKIRVDTKVLEYWQHSEDTILQNLAKVAFCVSPTQATYERAFNAIRLILTHKRLKIEPHLLTDILMIESNQYIFDQILL